MAYAANAERRLYTGVEGEKEHTGELYGVKVRKKEKGDRLGARLLSSSPQNIFKYTEHFSLTEKAIKGVR